MDSNNINMKMFLKFIQKDCDRLSFIQNYLNERGVQTFIISANGWKHLCVVFPQSSYTPYFRLKTVIAHYDRVSNTFGANDNSAAVFSIMNWVCRLNNPSIIHNVNVVFTDGEEIGGKNHDGLVMENISAHFSGIESQGSYMLAKRWLSHGRNDDDVFVFDCCGRGIVPILSKINCPKNADPVFKKKIHRLYNDSTMILQSCCFGRWISAPLPFSDNAGLIAAGIPAVEITFLPVDEATKYVIDVGKVLALEYYVLNRKAESGSQNEASALHELLPYSWKILHSDDDNAESLTTESFVLMEKILDTIATFKAVFDGVN